MVRGTEIILNGEVVKRSRNLRGVLDYARTQPVLKCEIDRVEKRGGYTVKFTFYNGATEESSWASDVCALDWCYSRRSWGKPIDRQTELVRGMLYKTTIIWYKQTPA